MKRFFTVFFLLILFNPPAPAAEPFFSSSAKTKLIFNTSIQGHGKDFSGVTYVPSKGHYFIIDDSCRILEIRAEAKGVTHLRTVKLRGFKDCEAILHLPLQSAEDSLKMAVTEEGRGNFFLFDLKDGVTSIDRREAQIFFVAKMGEFWNDNTGLEALTADTNQQPPVFYIGKEEFPRGLYRGIVTTPKEWHYEMPWDAEKKLPAKSDLADLLFFEGSLFVLDQRGSKIRQVTPQTGDILSEYQLPFPTIFGPLYEGLSIFKKQAGIYQMLIVAEKNNVLLFEVRKD